jgi:hypothetical protein
MLEGLPSSTQVCEALLHTICQCTFCLRPQQKYWTNKEEFFLAGCEYKEKIQTHTLGGNM